MKFNAALFTLFVFAVVVIVIIIRVIACCCGGGVCFSLSSLRVVCEVDSYYLLAYTLNAQSLGVEYHNELLLLTCAVTWMSWHALEGCALAAFVC